MASSVDIGVLVYSCTCGEKVHSTIPNHNNIAWCAATINFVSFPLNIDPGTHVSLRVPLTLPDNTTEQDHLPWLFRALDNLFC